MMAAALSFWGNWARVLAAGNATEAAAKIGEGATITFRPASYFSQANETSGEGESEQQYELGSG